MIAAHKRRPRMAQRSKLLSALVSGAFIGRAWSKHEPARVW
jgi:hypothetical protein